MPPLASLVLRRRESDSLPCRRPACSQRRDMCQSQETAYTQHHVSQGRSAPSQDGPSQVQRLPTKHTARVLLVPSENADVQSVRPDSRQRGLEYRHNATTTIHRRADLLATGPSQETTSSLFLRRQYVARGRPYSEGGIAAARATSSRVGGSDEILLSTRQCYLHVISSGSLGHTAVNTGHTTVNTGHTAVNTGYNVVNTGHTAINNGHTTVNTGHNVVNTGHTAVITGHNAVNTGHTAVITGHNVVYPDILL